MAPLAAKGPTAQAAAAAAGAGKEGRHLLHQGAAVPASAPAGT